MTGHCTVCGPVELRTAKGKPLKNGGHVIKYRCATKVRQIQQRKSVRRYGMATDNYQRDFDAFVTAQNNLCGICEGPLGEKPALDHDHESGRIRGVLCNPCNRGLGMFRDSVDRLQSAVDYLSS